MIPSFTPTDDWNTKLEQNKIYKKNFLVDFKAIFDKVIDVSQKIIQETIFHI